MDGRVEGFLVPVHSPAARAMLDDVFVRDLKGTGLWGGQRAPSPEIVERVAKAVSLVRYWEANPDAAEPRSLELDRDRLKEIDEAWLPVRTPDGPGVLIWPNSD
jgi:hypothetical protein